jgi:ribosomal protein S18 acetylase RimI-like enzyme
MSSEARGAAGPGAIIRDAQPADAAPMAAAVAGQPLLIRYGTTAEKLGRDLGAAIARGEGVLVADDGGELRGLAWFLPSGTFALGGYLRLIALAPGREHAGLGGALLDEVERRVARSSRLVFLLVSHWNGGARRFYAARGYAEVGLLRGLVLPDTDEIICMKRLR